MSKEELANMYTQKSTKTLSFSYIEEAEEWKKESINDIIKFRDFF